MYRPAFLFLLATPVAAAEPTPADRDFFEQKVRPVLVERCHKCHSQEAKKQRGGLLLDSRSAVVVGGDSGPAVVAGEPEKSLLIRAIRYQHEQLQMPPTGKLPAREVAVLEEWVRRGAPFPGGDGAVKPQTTVNIAEGRKFWSFQPPRTIDPPPVRDAAWPRRRIDNFLLAAMEKRGLAPSPPATRRVLIRRATFDLIGLPPTPEEVEAFVNDKSPDAYEKLVERLLASPQYGERWARVWLDLARYADVLEQWAEVKGQPWLYRDWVVRALNEDVPYDRFVQQQLAADLMPNADPADRAALGFLGLSPSYWKELKLAPDVIKTVVAEEWEERIGAVTGTFLGLTVACARCHDHKFDPVSQADYYALAGVLASTRPADRPLEDVRFAVTDFRLPAPAPVAPIDAAVMAVQSTLGKQQSKAPLAPAVEDASLMVLPDGPHKTKVEYKPGVTQDVAVQVRGNPASPGPVVPRRFLAVLSADPPRPFTQGSGRLELARAIVTEGAPLASRVIVNRVWKQHFGGGLVETPSDFGAQGARPTHRELLDDLAARFVSPAAMRSRGEGGASETGGGWSLKWLHREIVLSAAYRQASGPDAAKQAADPDNKLLWRMNRRRLEIEAWRDAMLAVSGTLNPQRGGPPADLGDPNNRRRTLYGAVKRRELHDVLRLHDFPDPTAHSAARVATTTPLQQLFVLNSPFVQQQAAALAGRVKGASPVAVEPRVQRAYQLLFGRPATAAQVRLAVEFLTPQNDEGWQQYCQALLGSNEFLFID
jgi:hypothetical protein